MKLCFFPSSSWTRHLVVWFLFLMYVPAWADGNFPVKIGRTEIQLSMPAGMSEVPKNDPRFKALADLDNPDQIILRTCISTEALDLTKAPDPAEDILTSRVFVLKDAMMDIDSGTFIDFVEQQAREVTHSVLQSQNSSFDFVETQKRLDAFQKDTGVGLQDASDIYSLGMVSRSDACIAFMTAQYIDVTEKGKTERQKCIDVYAFVRLKQKVLLILTSLVKPVILHDDVRTLKQAAEKYQLDLQFLNNS